MQLPSKFQIGDTVTVKRESGQVTHESIKVAGVQFTEGKVAYLFDEGPDVDHYVVVNSEWVEPSLSQAEAMDVLVKDLTAHMD